MQDCLRSLMNINSEVILDAQYRPTSREHQMMYVFLPPTLGGYSQLSPLQELVDSYIMLDGKTIEGNRNIV